MTEENKKSPESENSLWVDPKVKESGDGSKEKPYETVQEAYQHWMRNIKRIIIEDSQ